jgi:hypothetical protein
LTFLTRPFPREQVHAWLRTLGAGAAVRRPRGCCAAHLLLPVSATVQAMSWIALAWLLCSPPAGACGCVGRALAPDNVTTRTKPRT